MAKSATSPAKSKLKSAAKAALRSKPAKKVSKVVSAAVKAVNKGARADKKLPLSKARRAPLEGKSGTTVKLAPATRKAPAPLEATAPLAKAKSKTTKTAEPALRSVTGEVEVGSAAPSFELQNDAERPVSSRELSGKPYVLYFYPKDDTPGCTTEACGFRDSLNRFSKSGVRVLGVSPDSAKSHAKFKQKYGLNFDLLSDTDKTLANAYGVWVKKQNYGREYMGIERSTFLVDGGGVVRKAWRRVRVDGHVDAVLAEAGALS